RCRTYTCTSSAGGRWGRCSRVSALVQAGAKIAGRRLGLPSCRQPLGSRDDLISEGRMMATAAERGGLLGRVKPLDAILATAEKKGLHRSLGAFQLTLLGIGAVIGTGIFVLTDRKSVV